MGHLIFKKCSNQIAWTDNHAPKIDFGNRFDHQIVEMIISPLFNLQIVFEDHTSLKINLFLKSNQKFLDSGWVLVSNLSINFKETKGSTDIFHNRNYQNSEIFF